MNTRALRFIAALLAGGPGCDRGQAPSGVVPAPEAPEAGTRTTDEAPFIRPADALSGDPGCVGSRPDGAACQGDPDCCDLAMACVEGACRPRCGPTVACADDRACVAREAGGMACLARCEAITGEGCSPEERCLLAGEGEGGMPLGACHRLPAGRLHAGEPCSDDMIAGPERTCAPGLVCVSPRIDTAPACALVCAAASLCPRPARCVVGLLGHEMPNVGICLGECEPLAADSCDAGQTCRAGGLGADETGAESVFGYCEGAGSRGLREEEPCRADPVSGDDDCDPGLLCFAGEPDGGSVCRRVCDPARPGSCDATSDCVDVGFGLARFGLCRRRPCVPAAEVCNGLDDDCNGEIDDGFGTGQPCQVGIGACARGGLGICDLGGGSACGAVSGMPTPETCDGVDQDCDGQVDELTLRMQGVIDFPAGGLEPTAPSLLSTPSTVALGWLTTSPEGGQLLHLRRGDPEAPEDWSDHRIALGRPAGGEPPSRPPPGLAGDAGYLAATYESELSLGGAAAPRTEIHAALVGPDTGTEPLRVVVSAAGAAEPARAPAVGWDADMAVFVVAWVQGPPEAPRTQYAVIDVSGSIAGAGAAPPSPGVDALPAVLRHPGGGFVVVWAHGEPNGRWAWQALHLDWAEDPGAWRATAVEAPAWPLAGAVRATAAASERDAAVVAWIEEGAQPMNMRVLIGRLLAGGFEAQATTLLDRLPAAERLSVALRGDEVHLCLSRPAAARHDWIRLIAGRVEVRSLFAEADAAQAVALDVAEDLPALLAIRPGMPPAGPAGLEFVRGLTACGPE